MSEKITPRQRKAIEALLTNGDMAAAARAAGVSRPTLYRWRRQPRFQEALKEAERDALESLSRALVRLGERATRTLEEAMEGAERESTKVRAADIVLSRLLQLRELVELEERVAKLEERMP